MKTGFSFPEGELPSFSEPTLFNLLPRREIEVEGEKYTAYYESEAKEYDKCFMFCKGNQTEEAYLFAIQPLEDRKVINNTQLLNKINMDEDETVKKLIREGKELASSAKISIDDMKDLPFRDIEMSGVSYRIYYQSPDIEIVGTSLEDNYMKRVRRRWYQYN